ncbi:ERC protein 2-like [Haliotis cracherodii]|uniref:ERC protein 2-like n=1 Tax=Haliotis cracherodii TaxID=6455 RepID=UPI0039EBC701
MFSQGSSRPSSKQSKFDQALNLSMGRPSGGQRDLNMDKSPGNIGQRSASLGRVRGRTSSEGSGSGALGYQPGSSRTSPLSLPMDNYSSLYGSTNQGYIIENLGIAGMSLSGKSPMEPSSPGSSMHSSRTNSLTNVRDRSLDRLDREHILMGERSLDRHIDRMQLSTPNMSFKESSLEREKRTYNRDRSLDRDRDYPHMGARSLERSEHSMGRSRSNERNGDYIPPMGPYLSPSPTSQSEYRNSLIFELQVQVSEYHKECAKLQKELETAKEKLGSSMNSIKTFWSPELKKLRALKKEETAKCNLLNEQLKVAQAELKKHAGVLHDLEVSSSGKEQSLVDVGEFDTMKKDKARMKKEIVILRRTIDEMELRIDTQKQTLSARDESIKKLLEMLQSKGLATGKMEEDRKELETLKSHIVEEERKRQRAEERVGDKMKEIMRLNDEMMRMKDDVSEAQLQLKQQPASSHTMQALLESKDSRISALEKEVKELEDQISRICEDAGDRERRDGSLKNSPSAKDKVLKKEIEDLKAHLSKKDTTLTGVKMKVETLERQHMEQKQYIAVLKEQIAAKELHTGMLQTDIEDLQDRMKEKEFAIDKKSRQSQSAQAEKRRMELEMSEIRDHLDIKDRRVNVLQRKIESLDELVKEKDDQLSQAKMRLSTTFTDSSDSAISSLEESLNEREKQIERLREQRERVDREHQDEVSTYLKDTQEMKAKIDQLEQQLNDKQTELVELRAEAAELRSERFKLDSKMRQLESQLEQKKSDLESLRSEVELMKTSRENGIDSPKLGGTLERRMSDQTVKLTHTQDDLKRAQAEVDRLLEVMKEAENEKTEKDNQMKEMQEIIKEYKEKMGTLKRNQQREKKKNAELLEVARKSEKNMTEDATQLQTDMRAKGERIEELEEALRESVRITAQREMDMAEQNNLVEEYKNEIDILKSDQASLQHTKADLTAKVSGMTKQLEEKEARLRRLQSERHKHLEEVFEMKQEAIQAAICEKDANIALLEMTSTKKQKNTEEMDRLTKEKEKLAQQLKELTQNRMRLIHKEHHSREEKKKSKKSAAQRLRSATPEQVDPYVLTAPDASLMDP